MKLAIAALVTMIISAETFAQRNPRNGRVVTRRVEPTGRVIPRNQVPRHRGPVVTNRGPVRHGPVIVNRGPVRHGPVIVGPRYNPNPYSRRTIRTYRRPVIVWNTGFGYQCEGYGNLTLNGRLVHRFLYDNDCYQALNDIRNYGDFCDQEDLYDQSGILEAQFTWANECRDALGWYY